MDKKKDHLYKRTSTYNTNRVVPTVLQKRQMPQAPKRFIKFKGPYFSNIISLIGGLVKYCDFVLEFMFFSYTN